jgi:hypothetical protein
MIRFEIRQRLIAVLKIIYFIARLCAHIIFPRIERALLTLVDTSSHTFVI